VFAQAMRKYPDAVSWSRPLLAPLVFNCRVSDSDIDSDAARCAGAETRNVLVGSGHVLFLSSSLVLQREG
jgi:hypothetical protein